MPLPTFASRDEIPEPFRDEYEERDNAWHPKVPDTSGLTSALTTERERAEKAEKARKDAEKRAQELQRRIEAQGAGITDEQLTKLQQEDETRRKADLEPLQTELGQLRDRLSKYELEDPVRSLFVTEGGLFPEDWDDKDVRAGILRRFGRTTDGTALVVLDDKGQPTTEKPDAFVERYRKQHPRRFDARPGSGGGATRGTAGGGAGIDVIKTKAQTGAYLSV